jgi:hypothetical protein
MFVSSVSILGRRPWSSQKKGRWRVRLRPSLSGGTPGGEYRSAEHLFRLVTTSACALYERPSGLPPAASCVKSQKCRSSTFPGLNSALTEGRALTLAAAFLIPERASGLDVSSTIAGHSPSHPAKDVSITEGRALQPARPSSRRKVESNVCCVDRWMEIRHGGAASHCGPALPS